MATAARATQRSSGRPAFGAWLISQSGTKGFIGQLAAAATADRTFPKDGSPETIRARLIANQADGDMFEALDDAERAWDAI